MHWQETKEQRAGRIRQIIEEAFRKTQGADVQLEGMQQGMVSKLTDNYNLQQKEDELFGEHLQSLQERFEAIEQETEEVYQAAEEPIDWLTTYNCGVELDDVGGNDGSDANRQSLERMCRES